MFEKNLNVCAQDKCVTIYNIREKISIFKHLVDNNMYMEKDIPMRGYGVVH